MSEPAAAQLLAWRKSCRLHIVCVCVCGKRSGVETNKFQPNIYWRRQGDVYEVRIRETVQVTPSLLLVDVRCAAHTFNVFKNKKKRRNTRRYVEYIEKKEKLYGFSM